MNSNFRSAAVLSASLLAATFARAENASSPNQETLAHAYSVSPGGTLTMRVDQGDIKIESSDSGKVDISVHRRVLHAKDSEAAAMLKDHPVTFNQSGSDVSISAEATKTHSHSSWFHQSPSLQVEYTITTPRNYNLDLSTGGGNVHIETIDGTIKTHTAGGNLQLSHIGGAVTAHTDGGNITVADCQTLDAESDGGNLQLQDLHGDIHAKTGGGGAKIENCQGALDVESGGGSFTIENFTGPALKADTGGGSISADIVRPLTRACAFESGGGGIRLQVPPSLAVHLDASTGGGSVACELPVVTKGVFKSTDSLRGDINGGGPDLKIRTGGGDIKIAKR